MSQDLRSSDFGGGFVAADFSECFAQLRHYDDQEQAILRFTFAGYAAVATALISVYQLVRHPSPDLPALLAVVVLVWTVTGLLALACLCRIRAYFVLVARYLNEIRGHYLSQAEEHFPNQTGMYTDPLEPPYFNPVSSHAFGAYFLMILNSFAVFCGAYLLCPNSYGALPWIVGPCILAAQALLYCAYLATREKPPPEGEPPMVASGVRADG